jgi:ribonuclease VapC
MVVDTSALIAILQGEPESRSFIELLEAADSRRLSVASMVETSIVLEARHGAAGVRELDLFAGRAGIELVPVDIEQGRIARTAFSLFGKGRHRAGLNYGDCFSYALAITLGEALLCKRADFAFTDVTLAVPGDADAD